MVTLSRRSPLAMSSGTPQEGRGQGSNVTPHRYKPFSSHAHYQQVSERMRAAAVYANKQKRKCFGEVVNSDLCNPGRHNDCLFFSRISR